MNRREFLGAAVAACIGGPAVALARPDSTRAIYVGAGELLVIPLLFAEFVRIVGPGEVCWVPNGDFEPTLLIEPSAAMLLAWEAE